MPESLGAQPWTTPEEVSERWIGQTEIPVDDMTLEALIGDVEEQILAEFPDLADRVEQGDITKRRITITTAIVIMRHLRNPEGKRSIAETKGPYTHSTTWGGDEPGSLTLTDEDLRRLLGRRAGQKAFTIELGPGPRATNPLAGVVINSDDPPGR